MLLEKCDRGAGAEMCSWGGGGRGSTEASWSPPAAHRKGPHGTPGPRPRCRQPPVTALPPTPGPWGCRLCSISLCSHSAEQGSEPPSITGVFLTCSGRRKQHSKTAKNSLTEGEKKGSQCFSSTVVTRPWVLKCINSLNALSAL